MPESLKNFENHQIEYQKKHKKQVSEEEEKTIVKFLDELINVNDFGMCVPFHFFGDILESNKIKNQLELGHGTTMDASGRIEATEKLFGVSNLDFSSYPKYGFILDKNPLRHIIQNSCDLVYHYGNIILKLKKDNLFNRTTMTVGTSLDFGAFDRKCPMLLSKSNVYSMEERHQKEFYNAVVNSELSVDMPGKVNRTFIDIDSYELHFHGDVIISEDVEEVYLFPMNSDDESLFIEKYVPLLSKLNIPYKILKFEL